MKVIDYKEFNELVLEAKELVVVDFFANWCGPCKMLAPFLEDLQEEIKDVSFYKVNVDNEGELANIYNISSIPTLLLFKDGNMIDKKIGFLPKDALRKWIESYK